VPQATTESCNLPAVVPQLAREVEEDLARRLAGFDGPRTLREAMAYAVLGGGKRLRPVLTLLSCEAAGGHRDRARGAAAALELVHTFSLVHDDLPAMDDDDLRRGRPALHVHAGEAMAVLTGDALMSLAFEWVSGPDHDATTTGRLVRELAGATTCMIVRRRAEAGCDPPQQDGGVDPGRLHHGGNLRRRLGPHPRSGVELR
jgi:geranylgeranyl diphosphate synthase type II